MVRLSFTLPFLGLVMAAVSSQAAELSRRQASGVPNCTTTAVGYLAVRSIKDALHERPVKHAGFVDGVKIIGADGKNDSLLVTADVKGKNPSQLFEFATCTQYANHKPPTGFQLPSGVKSTNFSYGIVRPYRAVKHCLGPASKNLTQTTSVVDLTDCRTTPDKYREFLAVSYRIADKVFGHLLFLASANVDIVIGHGKHKQVRFSPKDLQGSKDDKFVLALLPQSGDSADDG